MEKLSDYPYCLQNVSSDEVTIEAEYMDMPLGPMERTSLNPKHWKLQLEREDSVSFKDATFRQILKGRLERYRKPVQPSLSGIKLKYDVWDSDLPSMMQLFRYRYITSTTFVGERMYHAGTTRCLWGCGESKPGCHHYLVACPKISIV